MGRILGLKMKMFSVVLAGVCLLLPAVPVAAYAAEAEGGSGLEVSGPGEYAGLLGDGSVAGIHGGEAVPDGKNIQGTAGSTAEAGMLRIRNVGAGTGERLSGAVFAVYGDGGKRAELTAQNGEAEVMLPEGEYYLKETRAASGYGVEEDGIRFAVTAGGTVLVEVTSEADLENTDPRELIPKTGEDIPAGNYALAVCCFLAAALCGYALRRDGMPF